MLTGLMKVGNREPPVEISCTRTMITTKLAKIEKTVRFSYRLNGDSLTSNVVFELSGSFTLIPY